MLPGDIIDVMYADLKKDYPTPRAIQENIPGMVELVDQRVEQYRQSIEQARRKRSLGDVIEEEKAYLSDLAELHHKVMSFHLYRALLSEGRDDYTGKEDALNLAREAHRAKGSAKGDIVSLMIARKLIWAGFQVSISLRTGGQIDIP